MRRAATVAVALVLFLSGCGDGNPSSSAVHAQLGPSGTGVVAPTAPATTTTTLGYPVFEVATAEVRQVAVYDDPGAAEPARTITNPNPTYGTTRVFLVKEDKGDWLNVYLPIRPNGSTGWVPRGEVTVTSHAWRIVVELGEHRLTVYNGKDVFLQAPVGVGHNATPTPGGAFYTTDLIQVLPSQRSSYGPYAFVLSGYSEVWYDFAGGDGQFGIHGTGDPSSVGRDVSNGCIRMTNDAITQLVDGNLPLGVPVEIRA